MSHPPTQPYSAIDVAAIIATLHAQIQQRNNDTPNYVAFDNEEMQDLHDVLHEMELTRVISAHLPLKNSGILGRFITLAQKIIRRLLRWYINPIVDQQNMYNDAVMRTMQALVEAYHTQSTTTVPPTPPAPTIAPDAKFDDALRIQANIAQQEPPIPPFEHALMSLVATRQHLMTVHTHWPLPVRKPVDYVANTIHRIQRISLRWYFNPIVAQMNLHNRTTHEMFNHYDTYITAMRISLAQLRNQIPHE